MPAHSGMATLGLILQLIAVASAAAFGTFGILLKRPWRKQSKADKLAVVGTVVGGVLALSLLAVSTWLSAQAERENHVKEEKERNEKLAELSQALAWQKTALQEIRRQQFQISGYGASISYDVSTTDPIFSDLVHRWDAYLEAVKATPNELNQGKDKHVRVETDEQNNVKYLLIYPGSDLFPKRYTAEWEHLFQLVHVVVLAQGAPDALARGTDGRTRSAEEDISFDFNVSNLWTPSDPPNTSEVQGSVEYEPHDGVIVVHAYEEDVPDFDLRRDAGGVISIRDLPGRTLELRGLRITNVKSVLGFRFIAKTADFREASGTASLKSESLTAVPNRKQLIVIHKFSEQDFPILKSRAGGAAPVTPSAQ